VQLQQDRSLAGINSNLEICWLSADGVSSNGGIAYSTERRWLGWNLGPGSNPRPLAPVVGRAHTSIAHGVRPRVNVPESGAQVRLSVDSKGFIRTLELVERETSAAISRERTISHLAVLKAAAAFGASRPDLKSADVLKIATSWLEWVDGEVSVAGCPRALSRSALRPR
jgi:hypothetical protein